MLNIACVNMPKIKPETKVLIINNLKSNSPVEVADIFNVSKWQVERIRKCYQEIGDVHDRPRSVRPPKTTSWDNSLLVRLTAPGGVDASDTCFVKNCTSDSWSQWSPRSYCCPETSTKQETQGWDGLQENKQVTWWEVNKKWKKHKITANGGGLGLHARSRLVGYQWWWERSGISPVLHRRSLLMT